MRKVFYTLIFIALTVSGCKSIESKPIVNVLNDGMLTLSNFRQVVDSEGVDKSSQTAKKILDNFCVSKGMGVVVNSNGVSEISVHKYADHLDGYWCSDSKAYKKLKENALASGLKYHLCVKRAVKQYDDKISDAMSIAKAVKESCNRSHSQFVSDELKLNSKNRHYVNAYIQTMNEGSLDSPLRMILKSRVANER